MKCPKCGFNSFEFLDSCKKCGVSLESFKKSLGISSVVYASGQPLMGTPQPPPSSVPLEEVSIAAAPVIQQDQESEESFTWDIPALRETAPETDTAFSGFDLDFMKDAEKPVEPETGFSFEEKTEAEDTEPLKAEAANSFDEFSFYENTLDPADVTSSTGDDGGLVGCDPFGDTGVMGEILPEQLEATDQELELSDLAEDFSSEAGRYENEFTFEHLSGEAESVEKKDGEIKNDPIDLSDFEKDFESIFQTDEEPDKAGTNGQPS